MFKYNSNNIFTGYIKQILSSFNLPQCKVFETVADLINYFNNIEFNNLTVFAIVKDYNNDLDQSAYIPHEPYIVTVRNINGNIDIQAVKLYIEGKYYPNITTSLTPRNTVYDEITHKYLGDYLRFIRDYRGINLLSLYNCFLNKTSEDSKFIYYPIPIKINTDYTLNLKCPVNFSYCKKLLADINDAAEVFNDRDTVVYNLTPITYNDLTIINTDVTDITKYLNEKNYYLILRLPKDINTSITLLDGNFLNYSNTTLNLQINFEETIGVDSKDSSSVIEKSFKELYDKVNPDIFVNRNFQLLDINKKYLDISYPFSDRLIEYLLDNVITNADNISKNILDAKKKWYLRYGNRTLSNLPHLTDRVSNSDRIILLNTLIKNKLANINKTDILGYVDKDIETLLDDERYPLI